MSTESELETVNLEHSMGVRRNPEEWYTFRAAIPEGGWRLCNEEEG